MSSLFDIHPTGYCYLQLLGNITEWEELIAPDALQELVLDGLLNRYSCMSNYCF